MMVQHRGIAHHASHHGSAESFVTFGLLCSLSLQFIKSSFESAAAFVAPQQCAKVVINLQGAQKGYSNASSANQPPQFRLKPRAEKKNVRHVIATVPRYIKGKCRLACSQ